MNAAQLAVAAQGARAVLYLRQSTHREDSISLDLQEVAGREYCRRMGYSVVSVKSDPGISGRTWNRPAVLEVMEMIETRQADVIVLWKWSRLSRRRLDWAVAVDKVESVGGRIESATEPVDATTSTGRLARGMLAEFAAFESDRIGDVWKETHQRRRRAGVPAQGGNRFGYRRDGDQYTPDPEKGLLLATMYRRYIAGEGFTRIVRWLNEEGHLTSQGNGWERSRVTNILDSGFGAGLIIHGKGKKASYYPGIHPAVISSDEWDAYRARRSEAPEPPRSAEPRYFLSGVVKCGDCGSPMHAYSPDGRPIAYICSRYVRTRAVRCVTARRPYVEEKTLEWLRKLAVDVERQAAIELRSSAAQVTAVNDTAAITRRITAIESTLATLTTRYLAEKVPEAAYAATSARLQGEHDSLTERLASSVKRARAGFDLSTVRPTLDLWPRMTLVEQRAFVRSLIREVRVHPPADRYRGRTRVEIVPAFDE